MFPDGSQRVYAQEVGTTSTGAPFITSRDPTPNDVFYPIGKFWINTSALNLWYLNSQSNAKSLTNPSGNLQSVWEEISVNGVLATLSDSSNTTVSPSSASGVPPHNIQIVGGTGISVVSTPASNLITITNTGSASTETLTSNDGVIASPVGGNINVLGGTTVYGKGTTGTITLDVVTTNHALLVGRGATTAAVPLSVGATSTVLLGNTGADPSFGQVPNGALVNGSVTINSGNNITVTGGGPLALGGIASVAVTGTTNHAIQIGNATGSLTSASVLGNGQLLIGSVGANPVAANLTAGTGITITNGVGSITIAASGAVVAETLTGNTGGAVSPTGGNINTTGTGSITIAGNPGTNTLVTQLTGLTNHAVLVGAGTATITNVGPTATAGQVLQSAGSSADPAFSTATYPSTTTINQILYSGASNAVQGLATANNGVLTTGTTGIPVITPLTSNGQLIIGSSTGAPAPALLTAGSGVTITNGSNSITISATAAGMPWTDEAVSFNASSNNGYFCTAVLTATLPASPVQGDVIELYATSSGTLSVAANAGQTIQIGNITSTVAETITNTSIGDHIRLRYRTANTTWYCETMGSWNI